MTGCLVRQSSRARLLAASTRFALPRVTFIRPSAPRLATHIENAKRYQDLYVDMSRHIVSGYEPYQAVGTRRWMWDPLEEAPETFFKPYDTDSDLKARWAKVDDVQALFDDFEKMEQNSMEWNLLLQRLADIDPYWACKYIVCMQWNGGLFPSAATTRYIRKRCEHDLNLLWRYEEAMRDYPFDLLPWWQRWYLPLAIITFYLWAVAFAYVKRAFDPWFGSERLGPWGIVTAPGIDYLGVGGHAHGNDSWVMSNPPDTANLLLFPNTGETHRWF